MTEVSVEATGETVGEAKWAALRELERTWPGLDKSAVRFQVVSEGERGLLGVGFEPARVLASVPDPNLPAKGDAPLRDDETAATAVLRELVERTVRAIGVQCTVDVRESDEEILVTCEGADLGVLIGRHGQTIDAVQYLANAILFRDGETRKRTVVDAAGYRARRQATLHSLAARGAERAVATGERVALEPMGAVERRIVHERLKDDPDVQTLSEGAEPHRFVVVVPRRLTV